MSEPFVPEKSPEKDGYHDAHPPRCPLCRSIIDMRGPYEGWCPEHQLVAAVYSFSESEEWEGHERNET